MRKQLALASLAVLAAAAATPARADVVIGPRVSYYFDNSNLRTTGIDAGLEEGDALAPADIAVLRTAFGVEPELASIGESEGVLADQIGYPMVGAMVNFGDDRDRFTLTAMYGSGEGDVALSAAVSRTLTLGDSQFVDLLNFDAKAVSNTDRLDVELTWQRRQSESFALLAGLRYERLESSFTGDLRIVQSAAIPTVIALARAAAAGDPPPAGVPSIPPVTAGVRQDGTIETFSARGGVTAFVPVGDSAVAFFNGMLQASYRPDYDVVTQVIDPAGVFSDRVASRDEGELSFGPDVSVRAQFILSQNLALDLRYRAVLFFPLSGAESFSDARVNHGVNLGLSLRL